MRLNLPRMRFHLSGGLMPINQKSSIPGAVPALGLSPRDHGAIASAIAPLMVLFVNVASPRAAFAQSGKDKKLERFALYTPQPAGVALADGGPAPTLIFATWRGGAGRDLGATPKLRALLAAIRPEPDRPAPALMREPIVGIASMYYPCCPGRPVEDAETASGEFYDAEAWTAAIQIGLRHRFGGVRYGTSYRAAYALVESAGKQVIVRVNDVGPLLPGRVIDLNARAMRYFDPTLTLGLVPNVRITPLDGRHWRPGPVDDDGAFAGLPAMPQRPSREQFAINLN